MDFRIAPERSGGIPRSVEAEDEHAEVHPVLGQARPRRLPARSARRLPPLINRSNSPCDDLI